MKTSVWARMLRTALVGLILIACGAGDNSEDAGNSRHRIGVGQALVLRQIYGGGAPGSTYGRLWVEIFNRGTTAASLQNLTVQAPGNNQTTGAFSAMAVLPAISLAPGQSFLVASQSFGTGPELPIAPDLVTNYVPANPSISSGSKIALVNSITPLPCGGATACVQADKDKIIDIVAFGSSTSNGALPLMEGATAPFPSITMSLQRKVDGTQDTNVNSADFVTAAPQPRNMDSGQGGVGTPPAALSTKTGTPFGDMVGFIYGGGNGSDQTGVTATIDSNRATWITGFVKDAAGAGMQGVTITVVGQSQYGQALSRAGGRFDMVVNGGATYTLRFAKTGYFTADRFVAAGWQRTAGMDDVVLIAPDAVSTVVTGNSGSFQVAASTTVAADSTSLSRTARLVIPKNTKFKLGAGFLTTMTLRLTEYTAGENGIQRMPAPLTGSPAYTYAVEVAADEATGQSVDFQDTSGNAKDVYVYVDEMLTSGLPAGTVVPSGYYDRAKGAWIASQNGAVIQLTVTGGVAAVSGATLAADELAVLALQYPTASNKKLWRVPINHMTPYDFNLPAKCDGECPPPPPPAPPDGGCPGCCSSGSSAGGPGSPGGGNGDGGQRGSIIRCDSQTLGEFAGVAGTDYKLNYNSFRALGYAAKREIRINLTDSAPLNPKAYALVADVSIAGQIHHRTFQPAQNLSWTFQWDGLDGSGRAVVGSAIASVKTSIYYISSYVPVTAFGALPATNAPTFSSSRAFVRSVREYEVPLFGTPPVGSWSFGGWTLNKHHFFDVPGRSLHYGAGPVKKISQDYLNNVFLVMGDGASQGFAADGESATKATTGLASDLTRFGKVAVAPNGDVIVADSTNRRIRRIDSAGKIWTIAGNGQPSCTNINLPPTYTTTVPDADGWYDALTANMSYISGITVAADGSIYVAAEQPEQTVRKITPAANGTYRMKNLTAGPVVCGNGGFGNVGNASDNVPASGARFSNLGDVSAAPDGSIYVADWGDFRVYRIDAAGIITIVAGTGSGGQSQNRADEGALAKTTSIYPKDLAAGPDGSVYVVGDYSVKRVDRNGVLHYFNPPGTSAPVIDGVAMAGNGVTTFGQSVNTSSGSVAMLPDGSIAFTTNGVRQTPLPAISGAFIRTINLAGIVNTLAVGPSSVVPKVPGLATQNGPQDPSDLAVAPNGDVLAVSNHSIYRIANRPPALDPTPCADASVYFLIPDDNGEAYCFDKGGRHKKTIDLHTGAALYTFTYDANGNLQTIKGPDNRTTTVALVGNNYELTGPGDVSQKTTVTVVGGNATSISDSIGSMTLQPRPDGLLGGLIDGESNSYSFAYDADGRLTADTSPLGTQTLARSLITNGRRVIHKTPVGNTSGGRQTTYDATQDAAGVLQKITTFPNGSSETRTSNPVGTETTVSPNGTITTITLGAAQQFGTVLPLSSIEEVKLPSTVNPRTIKRTVSSPVGGPEVTTTIYDDTVSPVVQDTTTRTYGPTGQTIVFDSAAGRRTTTVIDATGHTTQIQIGSVATGRLTPTNFNQTGGRLNGTTQGARTTSNTYQVAGQADSGYVFHVTDAAGNTTELRHDIRGRLTSSESAWNTVNAAKSQFSWWNHDELKTVTTPEHTALQPKAHTFSYNAVKEIQQYLPPSLSGVTSPSTNYTYTADRDLSTEQSSGLTAMTRTYIATTGQLDTIAMPNTHSDAGISNLSGTVDYDYYGLNNSTGAAWGQISKITGPTATNNVQYFYNGFLRTGITWAGDVSGSTAWTYNNRLWPSKESLTAASSTFDRFLGYDKDGLLICNSPSSCNPAGNDALSVARSPIHGKVTSVTIGSTSETWGYSDTPADYTATTAFGELRSQVASLSGTTFANLVYDAAGSPPGAERRDANGRIRFKTETYRNATTHANETWKWEYLYDERGQLKTTKLNGNPVLDATYDKNGNFKTVSTNGGAAVACAVDNQDRLTSCGGLTLTYYDNGEVKTKTNASGTWNYYYDALGRLRVVKTPAGTKIEYVVDGEGRRIAKKRNGVIERRWVYGSGLSPIAELDGAGLLISRFIYGSRKRTPDLVIRGTNIYRLVSDHLGSPRYAVKVGLTTTVPYSGNVDDVPYQVVYGPFGTPIVAGGLASTTLGWLPFGFAGGLYDPDTGLVHFGEREYDTETARWMSKDPIRFAGGQANLYVYVLNDPVNRIDPEGLASCILQALGAAGAAGLTIATCATIETGIGALGCVAGIATTAAAIDAARDACKRPPTPPSSCGGDPEPSPGYYDDDDL